MVRTCFNQSWYVYHVIQCVTDHRHLHVMEGVRHQLLLLLIIITITLVYWSLATVTYQQILTLHIYFTTFHCVHQCVVMVQVSCICLSICVGCICVHAV